MQSVWLKFETEKAQYTIIKIFNEVTRKKQYAKLQNSRCSRQKQSLNMLNSMQGFLVSHYPIIGITKINIFGYKIQIFFKI